MAITYLIGWSTYDKWYYGSSSKDDTLWKTYFTSSNLVEMMRASAGEPDVVRVHRIFDTFQEASDHESKFLHRLKAAQSERWLNLTNGNCGWYNTPESMEKMVTTKRARGKLKHTEEAKAKMRATRQALQAKRRELGLPHHNAGKKRTQEWKEYQSKVHKEFYATEEGKRIAKERMAGIVGKPSWNAGKKWSTEQKKNCHGRGKWSEESKQKMRETRKMNGNTKQNEILAARVSCMACKKEAALRGFNRWHLHQCFIS